VKIAHVFTFGDSASILIGAVVARADRQMEAVAVGLIE